MKVLLSVLPQEINEFPVKMTVIVLILIVSMLLCLETAKGTDDTQVKIRGTLPPLALGRHITRQDFLTADEIARINREHSRRNDTGTIFGSDGVFRSIEREIDNERQNRQQVVRPIIKPEIGSRDGVPRSGPRPTNWYISQGVSTEGFRLREPSSSTEFPYTFRSGPTVTADGVKRRTTVSSARDQRTRDSFVSPRSNGSRVVKQHCFQPKTSGPCFGFMPRYAYNPQTRKCHQFIYGGCQGNDNNFLNPENCLSDCSAEGIDKFQF
jgi:hypothetical protein